MSRFYEALREASRRPPAPPADECVPERDPAEHAAPVAALFDRLSEAEPAPQPAPEAPQKTAAAVPPVREALIDPEDLLDLAFKGPNRQTATQEAVGNRTSIVFHPKARLLPQSNDSMVLEHYRRLRTKILQQHETTAFRTVIVVSALPQEGKTVTTL